MSLLTSSNLPGSAAWSQSADDEPQDPVEADVQRILGVLESASPEVQTAVLARLLSGLSGRLPTAVATKAIGAARAESMITRQAQPAKPRPSRKPKGEEYARIDSQLAQLSDPTDPILAWHHFGGTAASLREVLKYEPLGVLEAMLRHNHMPPGPKPRGKSREVLADTIVGRLEEHFAMHR